jgi:hypothetical protein
MFPLSPSIAASGETEFEACKSSAQGRPPTLFSARCDGTVSAILALHDYFREEAQFCPPKEASVKQALRVLVKYLEEHPKDLHFNLEALTLLAFTSAWPCNKEIGRQ